MKCYNCNKELHRKDTYIVIHKDGEKFEFCPECREQAMFMMDWYEEFVNVGKKIEPLTKKTIVEEAKNIDFQSQRIERLKNVMGDAKNMIQMSSEQYHDLIEEIEDLGKGLYEIRNKLKGDN